MQRKWNSGWRTEYLGDGQSSGARLLRVGALRTWVGVARGSTRSRRLTQETGYM